MYPNLFIIFCTLFIFDAHSIDLDDDYSYDDDADQPSFGDTILRAMAIYKRKLQLLGTYPKVYEHNNDLVEIYHNSRYDSLDYDDKEIENSFKNDDDDYQYKIFPKKNSNKVAMPIAMNAADRVGDKKSQKISENFKTQWKSITQMTAAVSITTLKPIQTPANLLSESIDITDSFRNWPFEDTVPIDKTTSARPDAVFSPITTPLPNIYDFTTSSLDEKIVILHRNNQFSTSSEMFSTTEEESTSTNLPVTENINNVYDNTIFGRNDNQHSTTKYLLNDEVKTPLISTTDKTNIANDDLTSVDVFRAESTTVQSTIEFGRDDDTLKYYTESVNSEFQMPMETTQINKDSIASSTSIVDNINNIYSYITLDRNDENLEDTTTVQPTIAVTAKEAVNEIFTQNVDNNEFLRLSKTTADTQPFVPTTSNNIDVPSNGNIINIYNYIQLDRNDKDLENTPIGRESPLYLTTQYSWNDEVETALISTTDNTNIANNDLSSLDVFRAESTTEQSTNEFERDDDTLKYYTESVNSEFQMSIETTQINEDSIASSTAIVANINNIYSYITLDRNDENVEDTAIGSTEPLRQSTLYSTTEYPMTDEMQTTTIATNEISDASESNNFSFVGYLLVELPDWATTTVQPTVAVTFKEAANEIFTTDNTNLDNNEFLRLSETTTDTQPSAPTTSNNIDVPSNGKIYNYIHLDRNDEDLENSPIGRESPLYLTTQYSLNDEVETALISTTDETTTDQTTYKSFVEYLPTSETTTSESTFVTSVEFNASMELNKISSQNAGNDNNYKNSNDKELLTTTEWYNENTSENEIELDFNQLRLLTTWSNTIEDFSTVANSTPLNEFYTENLDHETITHDYTDDSRLLVTEPSRVPETTIYENVIFDTVTAATIYADNLHDTISNSFLTSTIPTVGATIAQFDNAFHLKISSKVQDKIGSGQEEGIATIFKKSSNSSSFD